MANQIEAEAETNESRGQKRKRGSGSSNNTSVIQQQKQISRTARDHKLYSSKLITALRRIRSTPSTPLPSKSRLIREAADRVLAIAARGRTRWSRAILANKPSSSSNSSLLTKVNKLKIPSPPSIKQRRQSTAEMEVKKEKAAAVVERKARVLGRLVPGCRKVELPKLLEETSDYIAALEMQIRAMNAIANLLSSAASPSAPETAHPR